MQGQEESTTEIWKRTKNDASNSGGHLMRFCSVYWGGSETTIPSSAFFTFLLVWGRTGLTSFLVSHTRLVFIIRIYFQVL